MTDIVNAYFRRFYPSDWDTAWETDYLGAGSSGRRYRGNAPIRNVFPSMLCVDGFALSVQGHFGAYSYPRDDFAEAYSQVEILGPRDLVSLGRYSRAANNVGDAQRIFPYVPTAAVVELIEAHGGLFDWNAADLGALP